jgi:hypothetical protein
MKLSDIPEEVLDALHERSHSDEDILQMDIRKMFSEYCQWEGLINYGPKLWNIVEELKRI